MYTAIFTDRLGGQEQLDDVGDYDTDSGTLVLYRAEGIFFYNVSDFVEIYLEGEPEDDDDGDEDDGGDDDDGLPVPVVRQLRAA